MLTYQMTFYFKSKFGNNDTERRKRELVFRSASDEEAIKKVKEKIAEKSRFFDMNKGFVLERGRVYRKIKILKETTFKPTKRIDFLK